MSADQADDFDESVFDAPEGEPKADTPAPEPKATDPKSQLVDAAKKNGWAGKEDWKGEEADWLDAPEFILKAVGEVLPSMRKALDDSRAEVKDLKAAVKESVKHLSKARQDGYEQRSRELQAELAQSVEAGDVANVKAITKDIVALEKEVSEAPKEDAAPERSPEFAAFCEENAWYGKDKALSAAFDALCAEVAAEGYSTPKIGLKEAKNRLKAEFPTKFAPAENPNRKLPGAVEAPSPARRSVGKSFSDMPKEHQDMCLDLMRQSKAITKENYAREFFAEEKR